MDFDSCAFHSWVPACRGIFCSASQGDEMGRKWWLGNWDSVWMAAIGGSNIGYAIGRYGGRKLVLHYGHYLFLNWTRLEYVETFFCRHGKLLIMGARFLDGLRQLNGIVAGMAWMPWRQFLFYSSLGAGFWVGFWGVLAYRLGEGVARVGGCYYKGGALAAGRIGDRPRGPGDLSSAAAAQVADRLLIA